MVTQDEGDNVATPLIVWACVLLGMVLLYNVGRVALLRTKREQPSHAATTGPSAANGADPVYSFANPAHPAGMASEQANTTEVATSIKPGKRGRVVAIDTFRGMSLCIMVFGV